MLSVLLRNPPHAAHDFAVPQGLGARPASCGGANAKAFRQLPIAKNVPERFFVIETIRWRWRLMSRASPFGPICRLAATFFPQVSDRPLFLKGYVCRLSATDRITQYGLGQMGVRVAPGAAAARKLVAGRRHHGSAVAQRKSGASTTAHLRRQLHPLRQPGLRPLARMPRRDLL